MAAYRDRMYVDPPYANVLRDAGLDCVSQVLGCTGDRLAAWSRTTDTIKVTLNGRESWRGALFIKRYHYPGWRRRVKAMLRGTFFRRSRAHHEYDALALLRARGVQTVRPIAYGERRELHFVRSCFLITEGVPGATSLVDFALQTGAGNGKSLSQLQRRSVLDALGAQVRRMHDAGLAHGHLFWRNILIRRTGEEGFEFFFLDAGMPRPTLRRGIHRRPALRDLSELYAIAGRFCSRTDLRRFARSYLGPRCRPEELRPWQERVAALAARFQRHEEYRLEIDRLFNRHVRDGGGPDSY